MNEKDINISKMTEEIEVMNIREENRQNYYIKWTGQKETYDC